jgi:hypothetical protein
MKLKLKDNEMTPCEINIAIAKKMGWGEKYIDKKAYRPITNAPDYYHDLNACYEAEMMLDHEQKTDYIRLLNKGDFSWRRLAFATAPQRCEAMLKTWGLWEESK